MSTDKCIQLMLGGLVLGTASFFELIRRKKMGLKI